MTVRRSTAGVRRCVARLVPVVAVAVATGCGDHHVLDPRGPEAGRVAWVSWAMIAAATAVTLLVFGLLVAALLPGERRVLGRLGDGAYIVGGGIVLPIVVLASLSVATLVVTAQTPRDGDVEIEVIGHQYWWEVRYPGSGVVTANEIHIPARTPVRLTLHTDDVIHSFWVPALAGKIDMIPGRDNHLVIEADEAGTFRGQCAEFCGIQHARMAFQVVAQEPDDFDGWLDDQSRDAVADPTVASGRDVFESTSCGACHAIRGTDAQGEQGPDLTHLASRDTLAALTIPNDPAHLRQWIEDPQSIKQGALMPAVPLTEDEIDDVVAYLETLR